MGRLLLNTSDLLFTALTAVIFARVILSWLPQFRYTQIGRMIYDISEPILRPIQQRIPPMGMFDISPIVAIILMSVLQAIVGQIIVTFFPV